MYVLFGQKLGLFQFLIPNFFFSHSFYILFVQKGICTYQIGLCICSCKVLVFTQLPVKKDDFYLKHIKKKEN